MAPEESTACKGWNSPKCEICEKFETCQRDVYRGCAFGSIIASVFIAVTIAVFVRFIL